MLTLRSPAKLNLFLHVVGRREDGYHDLASLFQAIDLCDIISFKLASQDHLTCNVANIPLDKTNLILKAAEVFRRHTGLSFGIHVDLQKHIPSQAGLGGGSGNAATALWALNKLLGSPANESELMEWSAEVGSDVPFFFSQGSAFITGRGEYVYPVSALPPQTLWVVKPFEGLSTPAVFRQLKLASLKPRNCHEILDRFLYGEPMYFNDLEEAAFAVLPSLQSTKTFLLKCGFETVLMSGSGSSFFCIGEGRGFDSFPYVRKVHFTNRKADSWY